MTPNGERQIIGPDRSQTFRHVRQNFENPYSRRVCAPDICVCTHNTLRQLSKATRNACLTQRHAWRLQWNTDLLCWYLRPFPAWRIQCETSHNTGLVASHLRPPPDPPPMTRIMKTRSDTLCHDPPWIYREMPTGISLTAQPRTKLSSPPYTSLA